MGTDAEIVAGRYQVLEVLGQGAFGQTVLAQDLQEAGRKVALKRLRPERAETWKAYELFSREAAVLQGLRHHGIPAVYEHFRAEDEGQETACLVMEYVEGPSLARIIEEQRHLDLDQVLQIALGLLDILDYLHGRLPPILHRDIKPANVLLRPDGSPALVDFGAVRNVFRASHEAGSTVVGTYGYMPFEQYMGQASPASDLYALGATLLHLLSGRPPADFLTEAGHVEVPPELPGGETLRGVLARLLAPAVADRFRSAREVRQALLAPVLGALVPALAGGRPLPARVVSVALPPLVAGQRRLEGPTAEHFQKVVSSSWHLMFPGLKASAPVGQRRILLAVLASVLSFGMLPAILYGVHRSRKKRIQRFFQHGHLADAEILERHMADNQLWYTLIYEFEADGQQRRGIDKVPPSLSRLWHAGDPVQVLYLPEHDYDSIIVSTR